MGRIVTRTNAKRLRWVGDRHGFLSVTSRRRNSRRAECLQWLRIRDARRSGRCMSIIGVTRDLLHCAHASTPEGARTRSRSFGRSIVRCFPRSPSVVKCSTPSSARLYFPHSAANQPPWLRTKAMIRLIQGCSDLSIVRSTLIGNEEWKNLGEDSA